MYLSYKIVDRLRSMAYEKTYKHMNIYYDLKYMHSEQYCDIPKHKIGKTHVSEAAYKKLQYILRKSLEDPENEVLFDNFTNFYEDVILGKITDKYIIVSNSLVIYLENKTVDNLNNLLNNLKEVYQ